MQLAEARDKYAAFRIPMVIIPATISNNVPGTDLSLGTDTALNVITEVRFLGADVNFLKYAHMSKSHRYFVEHNYTTQHESTA